MKKRAFLTLLVLFIALLASCASNEALEPAKGMIEPGDKIGNFLITKGGNEDITYATIIHCPFERSSGIESCELPVGTLVNVGLGVYDPDTHNGKSLDQIWSESTYEMLIDGRPVDLHEFGPIEITHMVGIIRIWNVVIVTDKPGEISARSTGVVNGEPFDQTEKLTFNAPG